VLKADAVFIRQRRQARVRIQALKGQELAGKVKRLGGARRRDAVLRTEIDLENPAETTARMLGGGGGGGRQRHLPCGPLTNVLALPARPVVTQPSRRSASASRTARRSARPSIRVRKHQFVEVVREGAQDGGLEDWYCKEEIAPTPGAGWRQAVTVSGKPMSGPTLFVPTITPGSQPPEFTSKPRLLRQRAAFASDTPAPRWQRKDKTRVSGDVNENCTCDRGVYDRLEGTGHGFLGEIKS